MERNKTKQNKKRSLFSSGLDCLQNCVFSLIDDKRQLSQRLRRVPTLMRSLSPQYIPEANGQAPNTAIFLAPGPPASRAWTCRKKLPLRPLGLVPPAPRPSTPTTVGPGGALSARGAASPGGSPKDRVPRGEALATLTARHTPHMLKHAGSLPAPQSEAGPRDLKHLIKAPRAPCLCRGEKEATPGPFLFPNSFK